MSKQQKSDAPVNLQEKPQAAKCGRKSFVASCAFCGGLELQF